MFKSLFKFKSVDKSLQVYSEPNSVGTVHETRLYGIYYIDYCITSFRRTIYRHYCKQLLAFNESKAIIIFETRIAAIAHLISADHVGYRVFLVYVRTRVAVQS